MNVSDSQRLRDLLRFYALLDQLEHGAGGRRRLADCTGRMGWPERGVYFFFEEGEHRNETGTGLRVVRVGTHALTTSSRSTLWNRLSQHKGQSASGGGNHRGSIFRLLVGAALLGGDPASCPTWGVQSSAPRPIRVLEHPYEVTVSRIIGAMPFLWLRVDDAAGPQSTRGYLERHSIALLSNFNKTPLDAPSPTWLGRACDRGRGRVRDSGLWNQNHVDEDHDSTFLGTLERFVEQNCTR